MARVVELTLQEGDIAEFDADVIALKFARKFHGADAMVMTRLVSKASQNPEGLQPADGDHVVVPGGDAVAARRVAFLGTPSLWRMGYAGVLSFGARILSILAAEPGTAKHVALTIHGPGFGLDEVEALLSLASGLKSAIVNGLVPADLERVTIVEHNRRRAANLRKQLRRKLGAQEQVTRDGDRLFIEVGGGGPLLTPKPPPVRKEPPHAFVAMPFVKEMDDVFYYGIQGPVRRWGRLCERVDQAVFAGDILARILERIETADVVIADLTGQNPNVYLEVGYAWAKGRPTVLLVQDVAELRFDVQGQRCIVYESIRDLETKLDKELRHVAPELASEPV